MKLDSIMPGHPHDTKSPRPLISLSSPGTGPGPIRLDIENLHCRFGETLVVQDVSLHADPGEHVAVIGGNGSGKTTLLRSVMGLHREWTGRILLNRQAMGPRPATAHPGLAWMPQRQPRGQFPFTVRELLSSSGNEQTSLDAARDLGIPALLHRPLTALSGGQLQRAYLARVMGALAAGAGLLLADEPTAALDFEGQEQVADLMANMPVTLLVVTHDLAMARKCHRVLQMAQGRMREVRL